MLGRRRLVSLFQISPSSRSASTSSKSFNEEKESSFGRKTVSTALICLTGGVALSAIDDLAIYQGCSRIAMEKASMNQEIIKAIGEPVVKGSWYSASLAVTHKRNSVSCSFPVSGPHGSGVLRLKAIRSGDNSLMSFFRPRNFDILLLDAVLYIPENNEAERTVKINVSDSLSPLACQPCTTACPVPGSPIKQ